MKLKRFVAADMRAALSLIKDELGPDAVIMSNKRVPEGIEIVAGIENAESVPPKKPREKPAVSPDSLSAEALKGDGPLSRYLKDDEVSLGGGNKSAPQKAPVKAAPQGKAAPGAGGSKAEGFAKSLMEILERQQREQTIRERSAQAAARNSAASDFNQAVRETLGQDSGSSQTQAAGMSAPQGGNFPHTARPAPLGERSGLRDLFERGEKKEQAKREAEAAHGISSYAGTSPDTSKELSQVRREVGEIKKLLQFELAGLIKDSKAREQPVKAMTAELLTASGFAPEVTAALTENIDADASFNFAWRELCDIIAGRLTVGEDEIITDGGIVTLIGPAGVGKTTTLAKLAARFVMNYGPEGVAIVTADHYRIGAVEQVKTYGRIMGCASFSVNELDELPELLYTLRDKSLVLVDTAGVGMKDERFGTQVAQLKNQSRLKLKHYLVLPATAQRKVLEQAYAHFAAIGLTGIILTKIDESQSLGDALSLCIRENLRLSYVTDGQRVPEDLSVPTARGLAQKALSAVESDAAQSAME